MVLYTITLPAFMHNLCTTPPLLHTHSTDICLCAEPPTPTSAVDSLPSRSYAFILLTRLGLVRRTGLTPASVAVVLPNCPPHGHLYIVRWHLPRWLEQEHGLPNIIISSSCMTCHLDGKVIKQTHSDYEQQDIDMRLNKVTDVRTDRIERMNPNSRQCMHQSSCKDSVQACQHI